MRRTNTKERGVGGTDKRERPRVTVGAALKASRHRLRAAAAAAYAQVITRRYGEVL